jgi:hypothetical protein
MDRAKRPKPVAMRGPGQGLGNQRLGPFLTPRPQKRETAAFGLGNGLSYAQPSQRVELQQPVIPIFPRSPRTSIKFDT